MVKIDDNMMNADVAYNHVSSIPFIHQITPRSMIDAISNEIAIACNFVLVIFILYTISSVMVRIMQQKRRTDPKRVVREMFARLNLAL